MGERHCDACNGWHDTREPWPVECEQHFAVKVKKIVGSEDGTKDESDLYENKMVERGHWIIHHKTGELIPAKEYKPEYSNSKSAHIIKDIEPYMAVTGEYIGGRRQHRDFLRAHGVVEVGNEVLPEKKIEEPKTEEVIKDIKRAFEEVGAGVHQPMQGNE